jgi:Beta-lactamase class C and other penicillin binding proteins
MHSQVQLNKKYYMTTFCISKKNNKAHLSTALYEQDKLIYQKSIGYVDIASNQKNFSDTKFRVGAITKMFTAVMVMQLIDEGKLNLETKLNIFYPKIPNGDKITIEHLLRHRSGLFNFKDDDLHQQYYQSPINEQQFIIIVESRPPQFTPGDMAAYSNTNYVLLSYIL